MNNEQKNINVIIGDIQDDEDERNNGIKHEIPVFSTNETKNEVTENRSSLLTSPPYKEENILSQKWKPISPDEAVDLTETSTGADNSATTDAFDLMDPKMEEIHEYKSIYSKDPLQLKKNDSSTTSTLRQPLQGILRVRRDNQNDEVHENQNDVVYGIHSVQQQENTDTNDLPVAMHVEHSQEIDEYVPSAVEFDPHSKSNLELFRRFTLFKVLVATGILALIAGVTTGVLVATKNENSDQNPREMLGIREFVSSNLLDEDKELLNVTDSPYSKALQWIMFQDPLQVIPNAPNFMQRYILAYTYFSTSMEGDWKLCFPETKHDNTNNSTKNISTSESSPTVDRFQTIDCRLMYHMGPYLVPVNDDNPNLVHWLSEANECDWAGVECNVQGQVDFLQMSGFGLTGTFPNGVFYLPFLTKLHASTGELHGSLPVAHLLETRAKHLSTFVARQNHLNGDLSSASAVRNLYTLQLQQNALTGKLPTSVRMWKDITYLDLRINELSGPLPSPSTLMYVKGLRAISMGDNKLNGSIPSELFVSSYRRMSFVSLDKNQFVGTIPTEIGLCTSLENALFNSNELTGFIPEEIYNISSITNLYLHDNQLEGTLSRYIDNFKKVSDARFNNNKLSGSLPTQAGNLQKLKSLLIQGNEFTGTVPSQLCHVKSLEADCLPDENGYIEIQCPDACCSLCCTSAGTNCQVMNDEQ